ncbi:bifunctional 2-polyprenyl-6-hydroxyphenol methylase/3-demethylubiquinol 3-O-methyltransferase UbiG [Flavobacterium sp. NRK F7]|uniref:class I SAM-dependent methyltransferase n=1 Tax=Flavobacterium sp. NRK F7 TaxID=2954930 RepID=UPI0020900116|nr:class I SAM-dependent methyltransferase [Flavobacterium sp. NRK F7]MCO6161315.1 class I SAM-dependent methyltransferase [Flavobacterium sp. NRK F7]
MSHYSTEVTSSKIKSDNPVHQRLLFGYYSAKEYIHGNVLEIGCGIGRGLEIVVKKGTTYTGIDKNKKLIEEQIQNFPENSFIHGTVPPLLEIENERFDTVISFHVIEHIEKDDLFLEEIYRVLKPNGTLILSTPNKNKTITKNPWHIREYTDLELLQLFSSTQFKLISKKGISGNEKVNHYFQMNTKTTQKIIKLDFLNLRNHLPSSLFKIVYEFFNRINRFLLMKKNPEICLSISNTDFILTDDTKDCLDLFFIFKKKR